MFDQMLPSLITLSLLFSMFLWALLIDFLIHLRKRGSIELKSSHVERRKNRRSGAFSAAALGPTRLTDEASLAYPDESEGVRTRVRLRT